MRFVVYGNDSGFWVSQTEIYRIVCLELKVEDDIEPVLMDRTNNYFW